MGRPDDGACEAAADDSTTGLADRLWRATRLADLWPRPRRREESATAVTALVWLTRAAGFALVGILIFAPSTNDADLTVLSICYAVIGLALVIWSILDLALFAKGHGEGLLPWMWGVVAVAGGFGCPVSVGGPLVAFAMVGALSAGSATSLTTGWTVTGAGILAIETSAVIYNPDPGNLLGYPLLMIVALQIGRNRRGYRIQVRQSAELLDRHRQLQQQQRRANVLDERARIAREIHDVLAHSLGALGIQIQAAKAVLTDNGDISQAIELLTTAQTMAAQGLTETRRAIHTLRTDVQPLDAELASLADAHTRHHDQPVAYQVTGSPHHLSPEASVGLLRIAQEALVNAAKHAPHQPITVLLDYHHPGLRLTITNPLPDHPAAPPRMATADGGYGLTGMRERLLLLGGTLTTGATDGTWTVAAELPDVPHPELQG